MLSEEQYKPIGTCPDCDEVLYQIGDKIAWHDCPYDRMDNLIVSINNLTRLIKEGESWKITPS